MNGMVPPELGVVAGGSSLVQLPLLGQLGSYCSTSGLLSLLNKKLLDGTIGFSDAGLHVGNISKLLIAYLLVVGAPLADGLLL